MSNWIKLKDKQPNVLDNNEKVLLYRIMNDSQSSQCITIHETAMVKHCNPDETWWQMLPKAPIIGNELCKHCGQTIQKHTTLRMCMDRVKHFEI